MKTGDKTVRVLCSTLNTAVSAFQFLVLLSLAQNAVKIYRKFASFLALASMIPLGIAELTFVIFVYAYYYNAPRRRLFLSRILVVTGAQGLVFAFTALARMIVFAPYAGVAHTTITALLRPVDWLQLVGGFLAAMALIPASVRLRSTRAHRQEGEKDQESPTL